MGEADDAAPVNTHPPDGNEPTATLEDGNVAPIESTAASATLATKNEQGSDELTPPALPASSDQQDTIMQEPTTTTVVADSSSLPSGQVTETTETSNEGSVSAAAATTTATRAATSTTTTTTTNKIMIYNILKYVRPRELQKMTQSWERAIPNLKVLKHKKPPQCNWVLITVESPDMVPGLVEHINQNQNRRGKPLRAVAVVEGGDGDGDQDEDMEDADPRGSSNNNNKRGADDRDGPQRQNSKRAKGQQDGSSTMTVPTRSNASNDIVTPRTEEQIKDAITPLWKLTNYEEQLDLKVREMIKRCARKIVHEVKNRFRMLEREAKRNTRRDVTPVYDWLGNKGLENPAIRIMPLVPSPQTKEYRNKCEFTFGYRYEWEDDEQGTEPHSITNIKMEEGQNEQGAVPADEETLQHGEQVPTAPLKQEEVLNVATETPTITTDESTPTKKIRRIPSVGCMASGWSGGASRPHACQNIPTEACALVDVVDEFLSTSPIPPYQQRSHSGLWRILTMRMSRRTRQCMVLIQHASPGGGANEGREDYTHVWESERQRLVDMLASAVLPTYTRDYEQGGTITPLTGQEDDSNTLRVTSIFFQEFDGLSTPPPEHPVQHAFGETYIEERLGQCTFQISPGAFFQVNTEAAEKLYQVVVDRVREVSPNPEETILLDICCGTGTIGITCLKEGVVGRVLGVDLSAPAIENAKRNAERNGFQAHDDLKSKGSTRFVAARAEHVIVKELAKIRDTARNAAIVAVVDPARDGLHADVVATIRANEKIQTLVYVSCNPTATLVRDAALLCAPPTKKYPGRAFRPVFSQPVDMFPLTPHCEMVMTFERLSEEEATNKNGANKTNEVLKEAKEEAVPAKDDISKEAKPEVAPADDDVVNTVDVSTESKEAE